MFVARLICSDRDCAAKATAEGATVRDVESLLCDCGCALTVIGWPDWVDEPAGVAVLRAHGRDLRDAA